MLETVLIHLLDWIIGLLKIRGDKTGEKVAILESKGEAAFMVSIAISSLVLFLIKLY